MRHPIRSHILITALIATFVAALTLSSASTSSAQANPLRAAAAKTATATPDPRITDGGTIADGDSLDGKIDATHLVVFYAFDGKKDDSVTMTVTGKAGGLVPSVGISTADGSDLLDQAIAADGENTATLTVTLPDDATYYIFVGRSGGIKDGTSKGAFTVTVAVGQGDGSGGNSGSADETAPSNVPKTLDLSGDPTDIVAAFQKSGIAPKGGKQIVTVKTSYGTTSDPGSDFLRMGRGAQAQDLVLQFAVGWDAAGDTSACGMAYRITATDYASVLLTNDGHVQAYQTAGKDKLAFNFDKAVKINDFTQGNVVTVAAIKDKVTIYINGKFLTQQTGKAAKGVFAIQVYNAKNNKVTTNCVYADFWVWSLDSR